MKDFNEVNEVAAEALVNVNEAAVELREIVKKL